jgi:hypothetical protein
MNIPAVSFMTLVKQYAFARGLKFFTLDDMNKAIAAYMCAASVKN